MNKRRNKLLGELLLFGAACVDPEGPALKILAEKIAGRALLDARERNFRRVSLGWFTNVRVR